MSKYTEEIHRKIVQDSLQKLISEHCAVLCEKYGPDVAEEARNGYEKIIDAAVEAAVRQAEEAKQIE